MSGCGVFVDESIRRWLERRMAMRSTVCVLAVCLTVFPGPVDPGLGPEASGGDFPARSIDGAPAIVSGLSPAKVAESRERLVEAWRELGVSDERIEQALARMPEAEIVEAARYPVNLEGGDALSTPILIMIFVALAIIVLELFNEDVGLADAGDTEKFWAKRGPLPWQSTGG